MARHLTATLVALASLPGCLTVERWPKVEPPYTPAVTESGRSLYVRRHDEQPVTIDMPKWEEESGRSFITGRVTEQPDGIVDFPRQFVVELFHNGPITQQTGRIAVDEIELLRAEPPSEPRTNYSGLIPWLVLAGLVVLLISLG